MTIIGIDTGGTFTDVVLYHQGAIYTYKISSTPKDFATGILDGIRGVLRSAGLDKNVSFTFVHSSTVATNAVLERKGAKTALITTSGFRDVLEIGRQNRDELYNLNAVRPEPLVPRPLRFEVGERMDSNGDVIYPIDEKTLEAAVQELKTNNVESVAVTFLFSFLNPKHERAVVKVIRKEGLPVSASFEILPEFREYERTSTTVLNAYVMPVMQRYLKRITQQSRKLGARKIRIVQSNGSSLSVRSASALPVNTLLSGPAAGVTGAVAVCSQSFERLELPLNLITFDMGGTSTDVALVTDRCQVTTEAKIGTFPVKVPMMDIHTVGAGGGSIAAIDAGGALRVGPQSAGAYPGPACYGNDDKPTVTDANIVLGRIDPDRFLGGRIRLDAGRSYEAVQSLARQAGSTLNTTANAIIKIVNANMERAIRVISVERGFDPRDFTLVSFGGAGGLHACELAEALNMPRVFIPVYPGVLSAWGAVCGDVVKEFSQTVMLPLSGEANNKILLAVRRLQRKALPEMLKEGFARKQVTIEPSLDLRYKGQSYELNVPYEKHLKRSVSAFHELHHQRYGHADEQAALEAVTVRLRASASHSKPELQPIKQGGDDSKGALIAKTKTSAVYDRNQFLAGNRITGNSVIIEDYSTTLVPKNWSGVVDEFGNIVLTRK